MANWIAQNRQLLAQDLAGWVRDVYDALKELKQYMTDTFGVGTEVKLDEEQKLLLNLKYAQEGLTEAIKKGDQALIELHRKNVAYWEKELEYYRARSQYKTGGGFGDDDYNKKLKETKNNLDEVTNSKNKERTALDKNNESLRVGTEKLKEIDAALVEYFGDLDELAGAYEQLAKRDEKYFNQAKENWETAGIYRKEAMRVEAEEREKQRQDELKAEDDKNRELERKNRDMLEQQKRDWEQFTGDISDIFVGGIDGMINGSIDSWDDFMDYLIKSFEQMLIELAMEWAKNGLQAIFSGDLGDWWQGIKDFIGGFGDAEDAVSSFAGAKADELETMKSNNNAIEKAVTGLAKFGYAAYKAKDRVKDLDTVTKQTSFAEEASAAWGNTTYYGNAELNNPSSYASDWDAINREIEEGTAASSVNYVKAAGGGVQIYAGSNSLGSGVRSMREEGVNVGNVAQTGVGAYGIYSGGQAVTSGLGMTGVSGAASGALGLIIAGGIGILQHIITGHGWLDDFMAGVFGTGQAPKAAFSQQDYINYWKQSPGTLEQKKYSKVYDEDRIVTAYQGIAASWRESAKRMEQTIGVDLSKITKEDWSKIVDSMDQNAAKMSDGMMQAFLDYQKKAKEAEQNWARMSDEQRRKTSTELAKQWVDLQQKFGTFNQDLIKTFDYGGTELGARIRDAIQESKVNVDVKVNVAGGGYSTKTTTNTQSARDKFENPPRQMTPREQFESEGVDTQGLEKKAVGGPVYPFQDYIVGESGPEVLRMFDRGGFVFPNVSTSFSKSGSGGAEGCTIIVNVGGESFSTYISRVADKVRVQAERAGAGQRRLFP